MPRLPSLSALALTGCRAGEEGEPPAKRARTGTDDGCKKHLVLVLGGVSHSELPITAINRMYARLAENLRDAPGTAEVVVVDPEEWKFGDKNGTTKHCEMELEDFAHAHPLRPYLDGYDRVAIVDDLQFGTLGMRHRAGVVQSDAYKQLVDYADEHKGRVAWWEFFETGMRELNNYATPKNETLKINHARLVVTLRGPSRHMRFGEPGAPENLLDQLLLFA